MVSKLSCANLEGVPPSIDEVAEEEKARLRRPAVEVQPAATTQLTF